MREKSSAEAPRRTRRALTRAVTPAVALFASLALAACGAKTGLETPDMGVDVVDATPERPVDPPICIDPAPDAAAPLVVDLATEAQVAVADVLFVIDRTGSMDQEIDNIRANLRSVIVPGLVRAIPDLQLGVVTYGDFPIEPYGAPDERPFTLERAMSSEFSALQGALSTIRAGSGGDNPEAMIEALYQVATGEGFAPYIPRAGGCPSSGRGYACVRPRAQPIILLIADAPSHNGPPRGDPMLSHPYSRTLFSPHTGGAQPHTYEQTVRALRERLNARVVGINSGIAPFSGRDDLVQLARDTGSVGQNGQALVFDIGPDGSGLGEQVVRAVSQFTREVRMDVTARALDLEGSGITRHIRGIRPQRAVPMEQVTRLDATTFYGVVPGTRLVFGIELDRAGLAPTQREQRYRVRIEFLSEGRPTLGFRDVEIVVPALNARCET